MSLNDPNWGRGGSRGPQGPGGGNQGPPDLDELWRNFNRRLGELLPAACIEAQIIARKTGVFR